METGFAASQSKRHEALPQPPIGIEQLDIPIPLVTDLIVRRLNLDGAASLGQLRRQLKLSNQIVEGICRHLMKQQLAENRGMAGEDYVFGLTAAGRQLAVDRMRVCHYAGPAPVSLQAYEAVVARQKWTPALDRGKLEATFDDLVVSSRFLDRLGPALMGQKSLFLFGPTGNGKTSIAERVSRIYDDTVLVPYAVEVDNQVIVLFDPIVHRPTGASPEGLDPRYVVCRRPTVIVGGELTAELLDLRIDAISNIYAAPLQMKANNGVLVIDDFGRQMLPAQQLLNRWIVPLDRGVDYLSLNYGVKFQIPFAMMVVFATNIEPRALADDAFLRRLPNKIYVGPPSRDEFLEIFQRLAAKRELQFEPDIPHLLADLCLHRGRTVPSACHAIDICDIVVRIQDYEGRPHVITHSDLERAIELYFADAAQNPEAV